MPQSNAPKTKGQGAEEACWSREIGIYQEAIIAYKEKQKVRHKHDVCGCEGRKEDEQKIGWIIKL